ncbi:pyroglutamyl-peptidase I [Viridibacillus sp. YIM B01967]|uniref:Pyrrolidone-carboxylate peptidase n=1 Tax=Viridibacillus soli TaxID=2798301 RepID=A0ABS1H9J1_9BACL|nr:pyroglutamyl-peptidase I [Viridibacillus soli]MBK3496087.1 pyroglutamyl-peptidase I [Viridibacillus soli]
MKKLLLTGFEPFLKYSINPTMKVVEALNGLEIGSFQIIGKVLDVDFNTSGKQFRALIEELKPDAIISLGLAGGRYKITPERIAINMKDGGPDNNGYSPVDELIYSDSEEGYFSSLPIRKMVGKLLERGYPASISNTAGTYLCNNIMYEGLHYSKTKYPHMKSGFVHIPASHELAIQHGDIPSWSQQDLIESIKICIEVLSED